MCFRGSFVCQGVAWEGMFLKGTFLTFTAPVDPRLIFDRVGLQFGEKDGISRPSRVRQKFAFRPSICRLCQSAPDLRSCRFAVRREEHELGALSSTA